LIAFAILNIKKWDEWLIAVRPIFLSPQGNHGWKNELILMEQYA
jgi:hypothetical protein